MPLRWDALARDAATVADLLDLGVDEQIGVATFQRPLPNACTCSSSRPAIRLTSDLLMRSPRLSTSWSTRRVETPQTYACWTTDTSACSERLRGCRKLGKQLPA